MTRLIALLYLPLALGWGTWVKEAEDVGKRDAQWYLLKAGIFSREGKLKRLLTSFPCGSGKEIHAWVTHRLSKGEVLSERAGKKLGGELRNYLKGTCVTAVELDVEPLPSPPEWLAPFARAVRGEAGLPIRLAVPPLSDTPLRGYAWKEKQALAVAEAVDGLDFMAYDTGAQDRAAYGAVLEATFKGAQGLAEKWPERTWVVGLPAYGRQKLHDPKIESVEAAQGKVPCGKVRLALYSGWTAKPEDWQAAGRISKWRQEHCP